MVGEALWKTERECFLWLGILLCCGSWWVRERSCSSCNKWFLQSIQHKPRRWEEAGAGLCRVSWSCKPHFCVCVCVLQLLQEGRECGSCSLWDACVGDPSSPCPRDVIPWAFHACPREQRGQRMLQNSQNSVIWGGGVVFHLLQWKRGHSQAPLLFPEWPEALGVENSKDLVVFRVGKEWDAQPWLRDGSCIPQEGLGEGQSCSWPGWSC